MKRQLLRALTLWKDDRGVALPLALMALMVLGALSAALLTIGSSEVQISYNHLRGTQAQFMAEAGMEDAFNYYRSDNSRLPASNATICNTADPPVCSGWTEITSSLSGPGTALQDYGSYRVFSRVLGPYTVLVRSEGTSKIGSSQKVLRAIITNGYASDDAVRTKGNLDSSGSSLTVEGDCGSVHTNSNYTKSGGGASPTFEQGLTATGTAASPGTSGKPEKLIPPIKTSDFWNEAKATKPAAELFEMKSEDGKVYDGNNSLVFTYIAANPPDVPTATVDFRGWRFVPALGQNPATWIQQPGSPAIGTGTYYFKQTVDLQGGASGTATILSTGDIILGGTVSLTAHLTDTLLVSDKDIKQVGGSATAGGLIAAHEQIALNGTVNLTGFIIAEDGATASTTVTANSLGGNVTITYDCDKGPPIKGPVRYLAWGF